jgi:hypothetical protein
VGKSKGRGYKYPALSVLIHFTTFFLSLTDPLSLLSLFFSSPEKAGTAADGGATVFSGEPLRKTLQNQNFLHQTLFFLYARFKSGT